MKKTFVLALMFAVGAVAMAAAQSTPANEALWEAARAGDTARITAALAQGADVNAKSRYDVTALFFAASSGRLDAVKLLMSRGANVNVEDTFYHARAADMALGNGHTDVVIFLVQSGAEADGTLAAGVQTNNETVVRASLAGKVTRQGLQSAIAMAGAMKRESLVPLIKAALDKLPPEAVSAYAVNPASLPKYVGNYRDAASGISMAVTLQGESLMLQVQGQPMVRLVPSAEDVFKVVEVNATLTFNGRGGLIESVGLVQGPANLTLAKITDSAPAAATSVPAPAAAATCHTRRHGGRVTRDWTAQLALVPRHRDQWQRRRPARGHGVGRRQREEHQVEDADPWHRQLEPDRVGQPDLRHHRGEQERRLHVQDRPLRRREAGR